MVLVLDGNSEIGAHVCYLICLRHLIQVQEQSKIGFFLLKDLFSLMRAQHVLSTHLISKYHDQHTYTGKVYKTAAKCA